MTTTVASEIVERLARHWIENGRTNNFGKPDPGDWEHVKLNKPFAYSEAMRIATWALSALDERARLSQAGAGGVVVSTEPACWTSEVSLRMAAEGVPAVIHAYPPPVEPVALYRTPPAPVQTASVEAVAFPAYGEMPFSELGSAVKAAQFGSLQPYEFDPEFYPGHQIVGTINFNSLNRIVTWFVKRALASLTAPTQGEPDDLAVDRFAAAMKDKLAKKRAEGRGGWEDKDDCSNAFLSQLLREHVGKGDPVDVGNLAMMIHQRGERIATPSSPVSSPSPAQDAIRAAQITMGRGLVDVTRIDHEGRSGILFRPRERHIPIGEEGELQPGDYWPVAGDVVIWIENEGGAQVIQEYLSPFLPSPSPAGGVREALERLDRLFTYPVAAEINPRGYGIRGTDTDTVEFAVEIIRAALSAAQAGTEAAEPAGVREALAGLLDACEAHNEANGRQMIDPHAECAARAALSSPATGEVVEADFDNLIRLAVDAVSNLDDWTNVNETEFTGWGDGEVPPGAVFWRIKSGQALKALCDLASHRHNSNQAKR